ncbi:enoyl-CoA hydratase-related protein [Mycolicibacterium iranicum]|uniref:Enoyl-CoA hydratase n=1 Tax=Mycolicibacterium iranicum TaxID=912594 RepID=A0A178LP37_MYCIR|nr:enoyl-CoA hydratase-related protein [Mycolicibacterium iranicum]OAN33352.1 enoyl-CoA hydratase [Mycolicibacterium iranicum]
MSSKEIRVSRDAETPEIATVEVHNPDSHNAIALTMYRRIPEVFAELDADHSVKVIVVRGAGTRSFASGADISEFEEIRGNSASAKAYNEDVAAAEHAVEGCTKPTIAMVHGYCIGGGCGLALACDIRFADERSRFGITPAKLGLVYSLESTKRLVDVVGPSRAKWILFSGQHVYAEDALRLGLIDELIPAEDLEKQTYEFARLVTTRAQFSVRSSKRIVDLVLGGQTVDDDVTVDIRNSSFDTDDYAEGVRSFLEKRPPRFTWS